MLKSPPSFSLLLENFMSSLPQVSIWPGMALVISTRTHASHINADMAVVIFSMSSIIERYQRKTKDPGCSEKTTEIDLQNMKGNSLDMAKMIELLNVSNSRLSGELSDTCSIEELQSTQNLLERSLSKIRARKNLLFKEQIMLLKQEEKKLLDENKKLRSKNEVRGPLKFVTEHPEVPRGQGLDVETELSIGCPQRHRLNIHPHEEGLSIHWL
ncbi:MADS-box protein AGL42 isoform X2 [Eucalyptus grandis]|uniref:MADS-box protein AGL42 isoform X2 n=1 Tax=Eucalyptus grandis TaxID=71139 RepID=UPI00192E77E0|nr:MADS-box protein AGL42 isoform X2 [Eucalyptus grandis]